MKTLLAIALLAVSVTASAVDITITLTAAQMTRAQTAVGQMQGLHLPDTPAAPNIDPNKAPTPATPGAPRDATPAEVRRYIIDHLRTTLLDYERQKAQATAAATVVEPAALIIP